MKSEKAKLYVTTNLLSKLTPQLSNIEIETLTYSDIENYIYISSFMID